MRAALVIAARSSAVGRLEPRRRHLGADRGAHRHEQRQCRERVEVLVAARLGEIAVEHDVGGLRASRARSGPSAGRRGRRARRRPRSAGRTRWRRTAPAGRRSARCCRDAGRRGRAAPARACRARATADAGDRAPRGSPASATAASRAGNSSGISRNAASFCSMKRASASIHGSASTTGASAMRRRDRARERIGERQRRSLRDPPDGRASRSRRSGASRPPIRPARPSPSSARRPSASRVIATTPR